ncbi:DEAD/DEAH box helicase [Atopococcus tabaci]|uniref:DEAD/DEAH box helicase n=1 Tax=Atopococcus tabaci TaxID=269774 RepID=UPI0004028809|nr:DEAD/DEAH box helicase [Atopococcus tabaci]
MEHPFEQYKLKPFLIEAISEIGFQEPTEIQRLVIPKINKGRDVIGQSQTGSGKTHAFLLPLFNHIDPERQEVQVVVTAPSRELAEQLYQSAVQLASKSPQEIVVQNYIGGTDKERQIEKLTNRQPHVAIGTPGRLWDLTNSGALLVHTASHFVVDEADMTLDMGFLKQVDQLAGRLPDKLHMMVFSATIPEKLQPFLRKYMKNPELIQVDSQHKIAEAVENWLISTKGQNRLELIYELLTIGQPYLALVFANTKSNVDKIADYLIERGLKVAKIHGDIQPRERRQIMKRVQNLEFQYVVATDLAARGIDIEGVSHVINAEIPRDLEFFVHRVGRTGRNNLSGVAMTLYSPDEEKLIEQLEDKGISFQPKQLKNGEVMDTFDRKRREKRKDTQRKEFDPEIHGMIKKAKKKVKPGYKKKLKQQIKRKKQVQQRRDQRKK